MSLLFKSFTIFTFFSLMVFHNDLVCSSETTQPASETLDSLLEKFKSVSAKFSPTQVRDVEMYIEKASALDVVLDTLSPYSVMGDMVAFSNFENGTSKFLTDFGLAPLPSLLKVDAFGDINFPSKQKLEFYAKNFLRQLIGYVVPTSG